MAKASHLQSDQLKAVRSHVLERGGVVYRRMCPMPLCHSAVVRFKESVVCLTCGWHRQTDEWGSRSVTFTVQQAAEGRQAEFRALALVIDPNRWPRLIQKARRRDDTARAGFFEQCTKNLSRRKINRQAHDKQPAEETPPTSAVAEGAQKLGRKASEILIYTDGSCDPNPGPGGWAAILWTKAWEMEIAGHHPATTNNRMEMTAALQGLQAIKKPSRVTIVTDSTYLFRGMTEWIADWSKQRWQRNRAIIPNTDLWQALIDLSMEHETYWSWTKAHVGQSENERCDLLAASMIGKSDVDAQPISHQHRRQRKGKLPHVTCSPTAPAWPS